jgi:hypothetical protein
MLKNKIFYILFFMAVSVCSVFSQVQLSANVLRNGTWVDHGDYAACPGVDITYQILNWDKNCHTMTVVNGYPEGDVTSSVANDGKITINWKDTGDSSRIKVQKKTDNACSNAPIPKDFFIPVLSLAKVKPTITQNPSGNLIVGFFHEITYTASAQYPWLGKKDSMNLNEFKLTEFVWTIPQSWSLTSGGQFETIKVTTDLGKGGNITAKAYNRRCLGSAGSSSIGIFKVERQMPSPCPVMASNQLYELCGVPIVNSFTCAGLPNNFALPPDGISREWSVSPSDGWVKLGGAGTSVDYQTDGTKSRVVTVTAKAYGVSSACSITIPLRLTNPLTKLKGDDLICTEGAYSLTHPLPVGASATWKVESLTPNVPPSVTPTQGTGGSAQLTVGSGVGHFARLRSKLKDAMTVYCWWTLSLLVNPHYMISELTEYRVHKLLFVLVPILLA